MGVAGRALRAVLVVVLLLAVLMGLLWAVQRRLVYLPDDGPVPAAADAIPGGRDVRLTTADGLTLGAWFLPGATPDAPAVLVANGNGGHRGLRAPLARALSSAGLAVLLFDYRGYGGNPGSPSEQGLALDVPATGLDVGGRGHGAADGQVDQAPLDRPQQTHQHSQHDRDDQRRAEHGAHSPWSRTGGSGAVGIPS